MVMIKEKKLRAIGARLQKLRKAAGNSKEAMAAHLGITGSGYHKNEQGIHFPNMDVLENLSEKDDVSMDWLLLGKGSEHFKEGLGRLRELENELETAKGELEAARSKPSPVETKPEVKELLDIMERVPLLYHEILAHFQRFKVDNGDLLEAASPPDTPEK